MVWVSPGMRQIQWRHGRQPFFKCDGPLHKKAVWLEAKEFPVYNPGKREGKFFRRKCRRCSNHLLQEKRSAKNKNSRKFVNHGLVPLSVVKAPLHELVQRCGGYRPAARALDASYMSVLRWSGRSGDLTHLQKESAARIFLTLYKVRKGEIVEQPKRRGLPPAPVINIAYDNICEVRFERHFET